jgi:hypothetical protein
MPFEGRARLAHLGITTLGVVLLIASGCGSDSTTTADGTLAAQFERLQPARRASAGPGRIAAEQAKARRVIAADPSLQPLLEDARGHSIGAIEPIGVGGAGNFIGVIAKVRLDKALSGTYTLPTNCYGVNGSPPFALEPVDLALRQVSWVDVYVGFHDRSVFTIDPRNGHAELAPGAEFPAMPRTCERESRLNAGE